MTTMDAARELRRALRELVRLQQLRERDRTSAYGVTVSGAHVLEVLAERGALSLNALSAELFVDKSTACRTVGLLEDRGLVARLADSRDGRAIRVELTDDGRVLEARLRQDAVWEAEALLSALPAEDADGALRLIRELTRTSAAHAGAALAE
ncbi:MarR family winged helix-turn-helix transcriptional regulator [Longimicrobium sp.]|uniref:MarR family winged helix-turn-helix transcriptional regulator n=1 Tax=Longimicrobium sp. TaxID=2029185 RepID=UPI002C214FA6|nr:MarR family transcriptional regulator [Longimicrobium sp.]HSU17798.1 MarR family transcriptional regulator [Longimicrobium sp.]